MAALAQGKHRQTIFLFKCFIALLMAQGGVVVVARVALLAVAVVPEEEEADQGPVVASGA
jgi:hypothetical protein